MKPSTADCTAPHWTLHCDGSAVPNPGRMGLGAWLVGPDGAEHALSHDPHRTGCNNEAEIEALLLGLRFARARGAQALHVYTDSDVLVQQLGGTAARPMVRLADLIHTARTALAELDDIQLLWVPRHRNIQADALARTALGLPPKIASRSPERRKQKNRR